MSEYVHCWKVQVAYGRTDIQRQKLVASLASINGAVKEYFSWCLVTTPPVMTVSPSADIDLRATVLHSSLLKLAGEHVYQAQGILRDVILSVYEEERPEMNSLPEDFSQNADFPLERFRSLYLDSLLLRRADVRAYCRANEIRQIREVPGLMWEDAPSQKADYVTPREPAVAPQPPQPQAKTRKKHGAISAGNAALILGVSERTVRAWDAGINRPDGYTGRGDEAAFHLFANRYKQQKQLAKTARAMNRPVSGGGIADHYSRSAFDED